MAAFLGPQQKRSAERRTTARLGKRRGAAARSPRAKHRGTTKAKGTTTPQAPQNPAGAWAREDKGGGGALRPRCGQAAEADRTAPAWTHQREQPGPSQAELARVRRQLDYIYVNARHLPSRRAGLNATHRGGSETLFIVGCTAHPRSALVEHACGQLSPFFYVLSLHISRHGRGRERSDAGHTLRSLGGREAARIPQAASTTTTALAAGLLVGCTAHQRIPLSSTRAASSPHSFVSFPDTFFDAEGAGSEATQATHSEALGVERLPGYLRQHLPLLQPCAAGFSRVCFFFFKHDILQQGSSPDASGGFHCDAYHVVERLPGYLRQHPPRSMPDPWKRTGSSAAANVAERPPGTTGGVCYIKSARSTPVAYISPGRRGGPKRSDSSK